MNLKTCTVPELLLLVNELMVVKGITVGDLAVCYQLRDQRTFTRHEKQLISNLCHRYQVSLELANASL